MLRARLSLRETQKEFADRFRVTIVTVHNWESGKTQRIQAIHQEILNKLYLRLKDEGRLMDENAFQSLYRTEIERRGAA